MQKTGSDLTRMTVAELAHGFRTKAFSPVEATQAALDRIAALNGKVNAFVFVDAEGALAAAKASQARWLRGEPLGPVDGVTASVKELLLAKGWPIRRCSLATPADGIANEDAPTVARLRESGAVMLGKTNSPEFGWKGTTDNRLYGATHNPWDISRTSGGSSGGAAAAAALGMGVLHLGTDGGGSIRIPAAFSGIFGLKPTFGRVPVYPLSKFGMTSHAGPMTRGVEDGTMLLDVLAQPDPRDWFSLPASGVRYVDRLKDGVKGLRIAYSPTLGFAKVDPEIAALVEAAAMTFESLGADLELVDHVMDDPTDIFRKIWATGCAHSVAAFPKEAQADMDPGLVALAAYGASLEHMAYMDADYARGLLGGQMNLFHQRYDLLLTPAEPIAAFAIEKQVDRPEQKTWIDWTPFTFPFNLTGQPAASIPCGFTKAGLPAGLQIVGRRYEDDTVLRACSAFEATQPAGMPALLSKDG
ncbi:MAG TPA: amidase [Rhizomicrobium sp.]|jgi:aspartyl-tRNA(Asn)/glutamyl-tRNA(Gln) amidotransferase subunit A